MSLKPVSKCLDRRGTIWGFEIPELLLLLLLLSTLNFAFSGSALKLFWVWVPTGLTAIALRIAKKGKPENYLLHLIRYQMQPCVLSAFNKKQAGQELIVGVKRS